MKYRILVIAAHPDDEVLGCGGLINKYDPMVEIIGKGRGHELDNCFDAMPLIHWTHEVEALINLHKPDTILTHYKDDLNLDHRMIYNATMTAARPGLTSVNTILTYESLSSTEWQTSPFSPNVFMEIDVEQKIKLMDKYEGEIREYPHSRSAEGIRALAKYRGIQSGLKYAEAYKLERGIINGLK